MNRTEFFRLLEQQLKSLDDTEKKEILADYNEHFDFAVQSGENEDEICRKLGSPEEIANEYKLVSSVKKAKEHTSLRNTVNAVASALRAGAAGIGVIFPLYLAFVIIVFAFYAVAVAIAVSGLLVFLFAVINVDFIFREFIMIFSNVPMAFAGLGLLFFGVGFFIISGIIKRALLGAVVNLVSKVLPKKKEKETKADGNAE